ncbi:uncharacterized protein LOC127136792 [Lathyrus oleraceus]|uniref:uncharacterized protein LOC127136792 n=1 Tax=Pisum sativum TaxID=3888 RepID=UPI0021D24C5E|nr:uncharacterized protein LOC127136792 [Pisum sativum]
MARKKNKFSGKRYGFKGSSSGSKDQDDCYNCRKPGHFIVECPDFQKDKGIKESFQKNNFKNKFKKSLMETWEELDNEGEGEKAILTLMASTFSDSKSEVGSDSESEALQNFIVSGFERTKLASMIYGVSKSKGEGIGFYQKPYNPRTDVLIKPSDPSSSSTSQKGLNAYYMSTAEMGRLVDALKSFPDDEDL